MTEIAMKSELENSLDISAQHERPTARFYRPELDILRFFAFLMVFIGHEWPPRATAIVSGLGVPLSIIRGMVDTGGLGVYVFFMLSSYLITELLLREKEKTSTIHVKAYYARRILRIWPLYFLFIGLAFVVGLFIPTYRLAGKELAAMLLLSGNWYFVQYGWSVGGFVGHLWSISVEEQFYLVWPIFLKLGGRRTLHAGCVALVALSFASIFFLSYRGSLANPTIFANSFVICSFFAVGGMTALWVHGRTPRVSLTVRGLLMICGFSMFLTAMAACKIHDMVAIGAGRLMVGYLLACLGCLSIFFGFLGANVPSWCRGLTYLGKISYGLYVFHVVCGVVTGWFAKDVLHHEHWPLSFPVSFLLTALCAALSYRFVETPFLRLKERFVFVQSRLV